MDTGFRFPGTEIRFGVDALIGLIPGVGDIAAAIPGAYIIVLAAQQGVRRPVIGGMILRSLGDLILGSVPLVGDLLDVGFHANVRNVEAMEADLAAQAAETQA